MFTLVSESIPLQGLLGDGAIVFQVDKRTSLSRVYSPDPEPHGHPPNLIQLVLTSKFTGVFTNITSEFTDILGLDCMYIDHLICNILPCNKSHRSTDFFPRFLGSGKYKIQIVARVGRKSAVVLSGTTEASYSHFFIGRVLLSCTIETYPDKKMRVGSLHSP